mmetsp:Transcript_14211/g.39385  ORF Transcript_14211/g.39385 Transcript_14211/m.39385 type:complete len:104 (+) Transcript_14211:40-351(+)
MAKNFTQTQGIQSETWLLPTAPALIQGGPPTNQKCPENFFAATGGGPCRSCPSLLSVYISSKFEGEAMAKSLKQELFISQGDGNRVDVSVSRIFTRNFCEQKP